ncbi:nitronate monooxygenase [Kingella kingae]|uniref:NAD(P)H-dependent flavin oxidoreductase n=1 Tax=Kingella kingae TaxID=504 RepID=UPI00254D53B6|nr:nitronate monooxygenase [Kingella kingae]MDK4596468.1 nitronate monooxygenase [Kingella kingae]MDK4600426.1 nitronate monooxygenase [Kingella kingae]MDK4654175.1 nitronate monooxygenase [Kingella kingae]
MQTLLSSLRHRFIQAPMAGAQDAQLAIAVCQAGGLGSLPAAMYSPEQLDAQLSTFRQAVGNAPVNVNFFAHETPNPSAEQVVRWQSALQPYCAELGVDLSQVALQDTRRPFDETMLPVLAKHRPAVVSFHFGLPSSPLLDAVRVTGAKILSSATTVREARYLAAQSIDGIIAQGWEAGGHRGWFLDKDDVATQSGTFALLPNIVCAVDLPVIAAGGIADCATVQAAFALGAAAVQSGTAFLLADEALTAPIHRAYLQSEQAACTAVSNIFTGGGARGIVTRWMRELGYMHPNALPFPLAGVYFAALRQAAQNAGCHEFNSFWAGQNAPLCQTGSAAQIIQNLMGETA